MKAAKICVEAVGINSCVEATMLKDYFYEVKVVFIPLLFEKAEKATKTVYSVSFFEGLIGKETVVFIDDFNVRDANVRVDV